ncbi:cache domain-containing protein [Poseidonocella sedimentorum]|uniref:histidine kinase n=1 Tax=Poseidonocella sedimentorum TaxID=871652 RepID=A0A1I6DPQ9_9RHOB|nr:cache domain-containing protein [Poseidonocella sedimentorum]SFR07371.1 hypothetical protein SAMN04515673_104218 [Poseidonocella sedimentorum]
MKSLGVILALALAGLQLFAVTIVVFSSYFTSERTLLNHARTQLVDAGQNVIEHTKSFLAPARSAAELSTALAENEIVRREQRALLEGLLFEQLRAAPQFAGVYYGDEEGNFVYVSRNGPERFLSKIVRANAELRTILLDRNTEFELLAERPDPTDTYDPRTRPWYQSAKGTLRSIWTDPYIFFTSRSPGITAATPVIGFDGVVQGVAGVDIEIRELSNFLSRLRIGQTGAAFVLNRNGDVIAHPNPALLTTAGEDGALEFPSIEEIADPLARAAFGDRLRSDGTVNAREAQYDFVYGGERYVSQIMPFGLGEIPWTIVVYAPENDFIGTIKDNRRLNTLIAIGIAAVTGLLGLGLANRIHAPVRAFAVRSSLVSQGEVAPDAPMPRTYKELENANTTLVNEISQRKRTEREYRLTFDLASRGMIYLDEMTGRILRLNARFAEIFGADPADLEGRAFQSLLATGEEDVVALFAANAGVQSGVSFKAEARRCDGAPIWINFTGVFIRSGDACESYVVATIDDVTQARVSEEKIDELNRELAHVARQQIMGELATGLAHELNQPLTAITQTVDAAQYIVENRPEDSAEVAKLLGEIDQQTHQAADIIRALRGFIRKEDNRATRFSINELLEQARRLVLSEARRQSAEILLRPGPDVKVSAVRVQVAQVLVNLLRNAVEAMAEAGSPERKVVVSTRLGGDDLTIEVEDSGPGVSPDLRLFSQFETTKAEGMGLGLSISRTLIESNGGRIWYDNSERGARFSFTLPLKPEDP